jgi:sulfide:quinone oxidoreductase
VVVHINEMPIKCPVAPLEFTFLADTFFREHGIRDKVTLTYVTPLSGAFTKPKSSKKLGHLLSDKGIELVTDFVAERWTRKTTSWCALTVARCLTTCW